MKYRAEIDGLRALAVVPVILFHAGSNFFRGGFVGVDVFFVISGYLISSIIIEEIKNNCFSIGDFYERRARRILPTLYVVIIVTLVSAYFFIQPKDLVSLAKSAASILIFSSNFYFWSERGYFGGATELKPLVHTWSLSVEEQFYLVFPILVFLFRNYLKILWLPLILIFCLSLGASAYVTLLHFDTAFYFPLTRAWELIAGVFCGLLLSKPGFKTKSWLADVISIVGLLLIIYAYLLFDSTTLFPYVNALFPVVGSALFIIFSRDANFVRRIFSGKIIVYIGLASYSLYIWHQPLFSLARHQQQFENNRPLLVVVLVALSVLSTKYIEKPFRNKSNVTRKMLIYIGAFGSLLILALSVIYYANIGFPNRYAAADRDLLSQFSNYDGYNQRKFDAASLKTFSSSESYKIVLIGDSHAKDFLNIIIESNIFPEYEFSTRQVNSECGNLMLERYDNIQIFIPDSRRKRCVTFGRYEGLNFNQNLSTADEIWLVSAWEDWVIDHLSESVFNLNEKFKKPIRIFGLKNFGSINTEIALSIPPEERPVFTQAVSEEMRNRAIRLNNKFKSYNYYYSIMDGLCGGNSLACRIFTSDGLIMSPDGGHLTKDGAREGSVRINDVLLNLKSTKVR